MYMASSVSSSSSKPSGEWIHDVFLSFRGDDTRFGFVDHLHNALVQRGIRAFKDDKTLCRGEPISPELLKAIEESKCSVVVFSENYANSHWCLEELAKIMECHEQRGLRVIPVFYHVDSSDVRYQKRKFGAAFEDHEKSKKGMESVDKWRKALTSAANVSGYQISKTLKVGESTIINTIIQEIFKDIQPCDTEENLIGIKSRIDALYSLLKIEASEEVRMVGIYGMGGLGKTTIAEILFERIRHKFEGSSFVRHVSKNSSRDRDICSLQEKIIKDIVVTYHRFSISDPESGAEIIKTRLCNKKVLLVLDDVEDMKQLEFLAARHEWFGRGSRIIITTRNVQLLSYANARYKPAVLHMDQAIELFCRHVFQMNCPPDGYKELSIRAVHYTGGLPLAIKVLGSYLHNREKGEWESILKKVDITPQTEIFQSLKLTFDGLDDEEKNIFLDIACFFKGIDKELVTRVLDSLYFAAEIRIRVLIEKSLVTISNNSLDMHDLIQKMGWRIVDDIYPNSRLWQLDQVYNFIKKNEELQRIEGMLLQNKKYDDHQKLGFNANVFKNMKKLRLLAIHGKFTSHEPTFLPNELRWLCWDQYPFSSLPLAHMGKLVGLEMHVSNIEHLWKGQKIMSNLKFVHLQRLERLTMFPDVSGAPNIESLVLTYCRNLIEVHESLGYHKRLVYVDMSDCWRLKHFPPRIDMKSLESLVLSRCSNLERFPDVIPLMENLSNIHLDGCSRIEGLPQSIRYLPNLHLLNLTRCVRLKEIPDSISELKYLKSLYLHDCVQLRCLPKEFGSLENLEDLQLGFADSYTALQKLPQFIYFHTLTNLRSMRKLDLSWRQSKDNDFPENLHAFSSLEVLNLSGNYELTKLPASISHLPRLKHLELNECYRLQNLHSLPSGIQVLRASSCRSLEKIIGVPEEYEWLYKIWLVGCWKLLEDEDNERYLAMMLQQSFLKKCAAVDHRLSIAIPGSQIPSWFDATQHGCDVALKLQPKWHSHIMGFAVSGVFNRMWQMGHDYPVVKFTIVNDGESVPKTEVEYINDDASSLVEIDTVWSGYIPFSSFQQMYEDWSGMDGTVAISVSLQTGQLPVRCGAHILYKEDVTSIQQIATYISDHYNLECISRKGNSFIYEDEFRSTHK